MATKAAAKRNQELVRFCAWCKRLIDETNQPIGTATMTVAAQAALRKAQNVTDTICTPCFKREFGQLALQRIARKANPSAERELRKAAELSERFHGFRPRRLRAAAIRWPRALAHLGPCVAVDYLSDKFTGKAARYFHEFEGRCELFAAPRAMPDGDSLLVIKGNFQVKAEGLTG